MQECLRTGRTLFFEGLTTTRQRKLRRHFLYERIPPFFHLHPLHTMRGLRPFAQVLTGGSGSLHCINLVQFDREPPELDVAIVDIARVRGAVTCGIGIELAHFHLRCPLCWRSEDALGCGDIAPCLHCFFELEFPPLQTVCFPGWVLLIHVSRQTGREVRGKGLERKGKGKGEGREADEGVRDAHR